MTVWITGVSGLVGGSIEQRLPKIVPITRGLIPDLSDANALSLMEKLPQADIIVHCAAAIPAQKYGDEEAAEINRKIDENIFSYAKRYSAKVLYASGISLYRDYGKPGVTLCEESPLVSFDECRSRYVAEKLRSEQLFMDLDAVIFRISSPYGRGLINRNVLKIFLENAESNKDIVYFGGGTRSQDFIHVSDIAALTATALSRWKKGVYNVAAGHPTSMKQLAECIASCVQGYKGSVISNNLHETDFQVNVSIKKAADTFGWKPEITLEEGIKGML